MLNTATSNQMFNHEAKPKSFLVRCIVLCNVLCTSNNLYKGMFLCIALLWVCSYSLLLLSMSNVYIFLAMASPVILQCIVTMMLGMRASLLLQNSQLHFVGIRWEIFVNLFLVCAILSLPAFDPKNSENLLNAKMICFTYLSAGMLVMLWLYSLQLLAIVILSAFIVMGFCLIPILGCKVALLISSVAMWSYFAYWLWRSPLQRIFKYDNFNNLVDYLFERFKLTKFKAYLTYVRNKEQVVLMGEGDGYLNRIFLSQAFSFVFTSLYIVLMKNSMALCLWLIMMHLASSRARVKVTQSQMKLWLLLDGNREAQFQLTERLQWRLYGYSFLTGLIMFSMWAMLHPEVIFHGFIALCLVQAFIMVVDYQPGYITINGNKSMMVMFFLKMAFMFSLVLAFASLPLISYVVMSVLILLCGAAFREAARKKFISANFTLRAS